MRAMLMAMMGFAFWTVGCDAAPPEPEPDTPPATSSSRSEKSPPFAYTFRKGDTWRETMERKSFTARGDEALSKEPLIVLTREERYEVIDATESKAIVELTLERVIQTVEGKVYDSRTTPPTQAELVRELIFLNVPIRMAVDPSGAVLEILEQTDLRRRVATAHGKRMATADDASKTGASVESPEVVFAEEIDKLQVWGLRPTFRGSQRKVDAAWDSSARAKVLFGAEITWKLQHRVKDVRDDRARIVFDGKATFEQTPTGSRYVEGMTARMEGEMVFDIKRGQLLSHNKTWSGEVVAKPQPEASFPGGKLKMRTVSVRRRHD